jgi:hypothetical protein
MSAFISVPSVEERLRSSLVLCAALRLCALLADNPLSNVPGFSSDEILKLVPGIADAVGAHIQAIKRALPAACQNHDAPEMGGAR